MISVKADWICQGKHRAWSIWIQHMSCFMTKPIKWPVHPAKNQISLGIRPVWSDSSLWPQWVADDASFLHADSEGSDQTQGTCPGWSESSLDARSFCWFCHEAAHVVILGFTSKFKYLRLPVWSGSKLTVIVFAHVIVYLTRISNWLVQDMLSCTPDMNFRVTDQCKELWAASWQKGLTTKSENLQMMHIFDSCSAIPENYNDLAQQIKELHAFKSVGVSNLRTSF